MQNQDNTQPKLETVPLFPFSTYPQASGCSCEVPPDLERVLQLANGSIQAYCNLYLSQKLTQASLQHQQDQLEMFMKYVPAEVAMFDRQMRYLLVSDRWLTSYKLGEQNIIGRSHYEVFPELPEHWKAIHQCCLAGAIKKCEEEPFPRPDGSIDWVRWEIHPWHTNTNEIGGIIIFSEVITERKQTELALREQEEYTRLATEAASLGMWFWDLLKDELVWTDQCKEMFGFTPQTQISYEVFLNALHPDDRDRTHAAVNRALKEKVSYNIEYRTVWKDGSVHWIAAKGHGFYDADGQPVRMMGTSQDITERKRLEEDLQQQAEELARTNRIKDEFLALLSHELRTPLTSILGWSTLLQKGNLNATKAAEAVSIIQRNAKLQVRLIEDLLDVSRILQGKLTLNITPVNLASKITAAIETVKLTAQAKAIQIQTQFDCNVGEVLGDGTRIEQVVCNLLSNAVKFTPCNGVVEVQLRQIGNHAQIEVSDTGKGILPEFLPYVFEYFRQQDSTTTRQFGGLGLGLAIVRQIVELHGGSVAADSIGEGQGATFTVKLPISATSLERIPDSSPTLTNLIDLRGLQILVVDDEPNSLDFVAFVLEQAGAKVYKTHSVIAALKMLPHVKPSLVVSDIAMPEMDGYDFVREIRSSHQTSAIPAIALSAYVGEINEQEAIAAGFQQHLSKPVEPGKLVQSVAQLIGKKVAV